MMVLGAILAAASLIGFVVQPNEHLAAVIGVGLLIAMAVVLLKRVERAIEQRFSEE